MRTSRFASVFFLVLTLTAWAAARAEQPPQPRRPDILLITIDTLRPDALGWIAGRAETPTIDALARSGVRFRSATTHVPLTLPAHASLFTSLNPPRHGVRGNGDVLAAGPPTLAEILTGLGYTCGAVVSAYPLAREFGLDRGFARYDDALPEANGGERSASATTRAAVEWIETVDGPWFLWVHYWDPHAPYDPPRAFWRPGPDGAYLGEVEFVDHEIGRLKEALDRSSSSDRLTVLTADHGESLGEHGEQTHGYFLYDATVAVPLTFTWPDRLEPREPAVAPRLIDVAPTILDLIGGARPDFGDGRSLAPILRGRAVALEPGYIESLLAWRSYGWSPLVGFRTVDRKVIVAPSPEVYDLRSDPGELNNIASTSGDEVRRATDEATTLSRAGEAPAAAVSREVLDRLAALGYAPASAGSIDPAERSDLADPKDMLELRRRLQDAEAAAGRGEFARALTLYDEVLAVDPDNPAALIRSGWVLLLNGDPTQAVARASRVLEADPRHGEAGRLLDEARTRSDRDPVRSPDPAP